MDHYLHHANHLPTPADSDPTTTTTTASAAATTLTKDSHLQAYLLAHLAHQTPTLAACQRHLARLDARLTALETQLTDEEQKRDRYHLETIRRKHNYIPFITTLLRILGRKGYLTPLLRQVMAGAGRSERVALDLAKVRREAGEATAAAAATPQT